MMDPFQHSGLLNSMHQLQPDVRRLQDNSTTGCFDTSIIYPVVTGELEKFVMKYYGESLPQGVTVEDVTFTVKADREIWSEEGACNNIRFVVDEELVYSVSDPDIMTLAELAIAPFSIESQAELLENFQVEPYFLRFDRVTGLKVTDASLPTRMPSSRPSSAPSVSLLPSMTPSEVVSGRPSMVPSDSPSDIVRFMNCQVWVSSREHRFLTS